MRAQRSFKGTPWGKPSVVVNANLAAVGLLLDLSKKVVDPQGKLILIKAAARQLYGYQVKTNPGGTTKDFDNAVAIQLESKKEMR